MFVAAEVVVVVTAVVVTIIGRNWAVIFGGNPDGVVFGRLRELTTALAN